VIGDLIAGTTLTPMTQPQLGRPLTPGGLPELPLLHQQLCNDVFNLSPVINSYLAYMYLRPMLHA
jgi:hypothetical protein